ncbi:RagB/SusD family nutrient uptake outer membrane protein [Belliella sp. DSM 111904]|uniref:RagB/SusD family nutrient uptake outer membrane protein n=1 Tax=Belliella filtrata TaxID=2923435 RepID=A0ABS9UZ34_9BACT|nr:RagB/SusD family nutrient uptake outer membrane protein [Belliella filtrata]MCH7409436.1 RagB/SusD family nutrient uptake outer membrane protein [Belliella filtrata]
MKKISKYILMAASAVVLSCSPELDITNPNQPTMEVFWQNATDAEQGVNAIYSTFARPGMSRWMPILHITRSDEGFSGSPWSDLANAMGGFIQPDYNFGPVIDVWVDCYVGIFRANQVIDNVPAIEMDNALKNRLLGEAYFLRGYFYYNLALLWGNVPMMLEASKPTDLPPTTPQAQVWAQVELDLGRAVDGLPAVYPNSRDLGRVTKGAAHALLAKVFMQQGKYDQAEAPLNWLVNGEGASVYNLMPNYRDNFLITSENNQESIFEWQFTVNATEVTDNDVSTPNHNYGTSIPQFLAPPGIGWADAEARTWAIAEFLEEQTTNGERDPRLAASYLYAFTDERGPDFSMVYGQSFTQRYGSGNTRAYFRKFLNDHWKNEEGYRSPNNYRVIRYADVLLMYAEVLNATGRTSQAYAHVDRVRARVGLPALSTARPGLGQEAFLEQLKHERLLELSGEGHRWSDLARWGDLGRDLAPRDPGFNNFVVGRHEFLPIPQRDLDINRNLVQNPGW